jgi:hypothetical protein
LCGIRVVPPSKGISEGRVSPKECKRLAEVDFPIAVVLKHAAREKLIVKKINTRALPGDLV